MNFTANRKVMLEHLNTMVRIVPKESTVKIMTCFLIEANENNGNVYITATNNVVAMQRTFRPFVRTGGSIAINGNLLVEILKALKGENVTFLEVRAGIVAIKSGACTYTINVLDGKKYPKKQIIVPDSTASLNDLKKFYSKTHAAVGSTNISEVLKGVHFDIKEDCVRVVGCNGQHIALCETRMSCGKNLKFTLGKDVFSYLASAVDDSDVEVGFVGENVVFMKEGMLFTAKRFNQEYINVDGIFEKLETSYIAKVDLEKLKTTILNTCEIASMSSETSYIRFDFHDDNIEMSTQNDIGGGLNTIEAVVVQGGGRQSYYYRVESLREIFKTVEKEVIIRLNSNGYLVVMDRHSQFLLMPMPATSVERQMKKYIDIKKNPKLKKTKAAKTEKKAA